MDDNDKLASAAGEPGNRQDLLHEIGRKLSQAREAREEAIDTPARILKLSKNNLQALESGNWSELPDEVYALGFLRQYSKYLQVDISQELERLKNDQYKLTRPLTFPDPAVAPSRKWAWIAGCAFILLFVLFNIFNSSNSDFDTAMDTSQHTEMVEPAPAFQPATDMPAVIDATSPTDLTAPEASDSTTGEKTATDSPAQPEMQTAVTHSYRFEAVGGDVWLQIFEPDESGQNKGNLRREALLRAGRHAIEEIASESVWITCGNAPALRIVVDGKVVAEAASLGSGRKILRDYQFSIR